MWPFSYFRRKRELIEENAILQQRCEELKADRDALHLFAEAKCTELEAYKRLYGYAIYRCAVYETEIQDLLDLPSGIPKDFEP